MPVTTRGRRIVEKRTGKTVGMAKSASKAKASARIRNSAYKRKRGKR